MRIRRILPLAGLLTCYVSATEPPANTASTDFEGVNVATNKNRLLRRLPNDLRVLGNHKNIVDEDFFLSMPTVSPTRIPTPGPSITQPSENPTERPAETPPFNSASPTFELTSSPVGQQPTDTPTTEEPTLAPTISEPCTLILSSSCVNCDGNTIIDPICPGPPSELIMRYTGGGCNQTSTSQIIPCFDFQGGPSSESASQGFIVVSFQGVIYFQGFVTVGSEYTIQDPSGSSLGAPQSIVIYRSDDLSASNVLQSLLFDGDCSATIEILDQFGASQILGFTVDGTSTNAFFNATIELELSVPSGPSARIESLVVSSSDGLIDLTDQLSGTVIDSGDTEMTSFSVELDVSAPQNQIFVSNVTAVNSANSTLTCFAESVLSIPVGPI